jgi:hypothetical protein
VDALDIISKDKLIAALNYAIKVYTSDYAAAIYFDQGFRIELAYYGATNVQVTIKSANTPTATTDHVLSEKATQMMRGEVIKARLQSKMAGNA